MFKVTREERRTAYEAVNVLLGLRNPDSVWIGGVDVGGDFGHSGEGSAQMPDASRVLHSRCSELI